MVNDSFENHERGGGLAKFENLVFAQNVATLAGTAIVFVYRSIRLFL